MLACMTMFSQVFTSHFDDGTYCSMTIIGNDAYFHHGTTSYSIDNEAERVFNLFGFYSYSPKYSDSYSYILLDTVEITYNRKYSDSYKVQDTVYENGFKKLVSTTKYRYYICKTVFVGKGRIAGDIEYVVNDSLYYTDVKKRYMYKSESGYDADGHVVMISGNKAYVEVRGSIKDNLFQSTEHVCDKRGMYVRDKYINNFAFDNIYVGTHHHESSFNFGEYDTRDHVTLMVDNTVQKSCVLYEVDKDTFINCGYVTTYSKDWEDK